MGSVIELHGRWLLVFAFVLAAAYPAEAARHDGRNMNRGSGVSRSGEAQNTEQAWIGLRNQLPASRGHTALNQQYINLMIEKVEIQAFKGLFQRMLSKPPATHAEAIGILRHQKSIFWAIEIRKMRPTVRRQERKRPAPIARPSPWLRDSRYARTRYSKTPTRGDRTKTTARAAARRLMTINRNLKASNRSLLAELQQLRSKVPLHVLKLLRPPPTYEYNKFNDTTTISTPKIESRPDRGVGFLTLWFSATYKGQVTPGSQPPIVKTIDMFLVSNASNWQYLKSSRQLRLLIDGRRTVLSCKFHDSEVMRSARCVETMAWQLPASLVAKIAKANNVECQLLATEFSLRRTAQFKLAAFVDVLQLDKTDARKRP